MELVGVSLGVEMTLKLEHVGNKTRPGREMETGKALSEYLWVILLLSLHRAGGWLRRMGRCRDHVIPHTTSRPPYLATWPRGHTGHGWHLEMEDLCGRSILGLEQSPSRACPVWMMNRFGWQCIHCRFQFDCCVFHYTSSTSLILIVTKHSPQPRPHTTCQSRPADTSQVHVSLLSILSHKIKYRSCHRQSVTCFNHINLIGYIGFLRRTVRSNLNLEKQDSYASAGHSGLVNYVIHSVKYLMERARWTWRAGRSGV